MTSVAAEQFHREQEEHERALFDKETGEPTLNNPRRHLLETVEWRSVKDEYPDADTTVLLYDPELDGEPVWPGSWDDQEQTWVVDGFECSPTHWAPMPAGPLR